MDRRDLQEALYKERIYQKIQIIEYSGRRELYDRVDISISTRSTTAMRVDWPLKSTPPGSLRFSQVLSGSNWVEPSSPRGCNISTEIGQPKTSADTATEQISYFGRQKQFILVGGSKFYKAEVTSKGYPVHLGTFLACSIGIPGVYGVWGGPTELRGGNIQFRYLALQFLQYTISLPTKNKNKTESKVKLRLQPK